MPTPEDRDQHGDERDPGHPLRQGRYGAQRSALAGAVARLGACRMRLGTSWVRRARGAPIDERDLGPAERAARPPVGTVGGSRIRSAARNRAEAARRLTAISASVGLSAPRVSSRSRRLVLLRHHRQPGGRGLAGAGGQHLLDQPVLERVVGQDGDPAADGERGDRLRQHRLQARRARALTSIRSAWNVRLAGWPPVLRTAAGIDWSSTCTSRAEVLEGLILPDRDDPSGDPVGEPLLAVACAGSGSGHGRCRC